MSQPEFFSDKPQEQVILDSRRRLSQSVLWNLQRNYFNQKGVRAWNQAEVPYQLTTNPWIAGSYAHVVSAWLRDWHAALDPGQPVYLIELGCGNGTFGYLFLKKLLALLGHSVLHDLRIKYIYTDFTEYNLDILRSHPSLQPLMQSGLVDFARFDLEEDRELHLSESGQALIPGAVGNPLIVLANYVFDGVRQDLFRISEGELQEALVSIASVGEEPGPEGPPVSAAEVICNYEPASASGYYDDPVWNRILEGYRNRLTDTLLLFPSSALACLKNLRALAQNRLLLLSGDKGDTDERSLLGREQLHLAVHGSISLMVNYHAIGEYVREQGGQFLATSHLNSRLKITACLFGASGAGYHQTLLAFDEFIEGRGVDDLYSLRSILEKDWEAFTLQQIINYLRLSGWDHSVFMSCAATLLEKARNAMPAEAAELELAVQAIWETYFPLREVRDVAFDLGALSMVIRRFPTALEFFWRSLGLYGPTMETALNMAICHCNLGQWPEALQHVNHALELEPESEAARVLKKDIEEAIAG